MPHATRLLATLGSLALLLGCVDDDAGSEAVSTETSAVGDGDGDPTTGDGDGDPMTGDGDGDPTTGDGDGDPTTGDGDAGCLYPDAAEPMALDEPIAAYAWPTALDADGGVAILDLENAYCDSDPVLDWSPHDILVFVSIPAW